MNCVTTTKNGFGCVLIVLVLSTLYPKIISADERYWQVKDLVAEADVIAIVTVKGLHYEDDKSNVNDLMEVDFSIEKILKGIQKNISEFTLTHPAQKRQRTYPRLISFISGGRYLIFLKYRDTSWSPQSLRLICMTSGAVHLDGNKTIRKPALLDGYPPVHRKFNEPKLLDRVKQLISIFEVLHKTEVSDKTRILMEQGYFTDTPEQIIEATRSESFMIRLIALEMLMQQTGEKAIPTLTEALNDPRIEVRCRAAHWLGTLGDKSGIEQMRRDFKELAPYNGAPMSLDPNLAEDPVALKKQESERNNRLYYYAIKVAKVLAELSDRRGYELAARMSSQSEYRRRYRAVPVLVEIAKTDEATLRAEGRDPVSILCSMVESEKNEKVFTLLTHLVATELKHDIAIRILEIAKDSPNQSDSSRQKTQQYLNELKLKKKAAENRKPQVVSPTGKS